jgi:hypothetical protein
MLFPSGALTVKLSKERIQSEIGIEVRKEKRRIP